MVHGHQRYVIHEVRFPELRGDADIVRAVARHELVAANLHPVFGLRDAGRVLGVDAQTEGRAPQKIRDEAHSRAVVGEYPRTRALETLLRDDRLIRTTVEIGLHDAVRPEDARHVDARARAQSEMGRAAGQRLLLREQPRADLDLPANPEGIDPLIARGRLRARTHHLPVVTPGAPPEQTDRLTVGDADHVELAVAVEIDHAEDFDPL